MANQWLDLYPTIPPGGTGGGSGGGGGGGGGGSSSAANLATSGVGGVTGVLPIANGGTASSGYLANNVLLGNAGSAFQTVAPGTSGNVLTSNGVTWTSSPAVGGGGSGTVTNVGLADGSTVPIYGITNSPVTTTGNLTFSLNTQSSGLVLVGPSTGAAAQPSFRALLPMDVWTVTPVTSNINAVSGQIYLVDTSSARNIVAPAPAEGSAFYIKDKTGQANANNIQFSHFGAENIEGSSSNKIFQTNWGSWFIVSDGANWFIL